MKQENAIIRKYLGDRIHSFRVELSISRESVAEKLGISKRTLASYERGEREITMQRLIELAKLYNTTYTNLTNYENILDDMGHLAIG